MRQKEFLQALRRRFGGRSRAISSILACVVVIAAGISLGVMASTATPSLEAENGTITGDACATADASGSDGTAVKFGDSCSGPPVTPAATGAMICGNDSVLNGPSTAPAGAVTVPAGDNSSANLGQANTTYWFAPGTHTLGDDEYAQIYPADNSTYIGAPGAIISGQGLNHSAFDGHATNVTIKYLTIQDFGTRTPNTLTTPSGDMNNQGTVNHDSGHNWTITHNTIQYNGGAGAFGGTGDTISYNCLTKNGQYGFSFYEPDGVSDVVVDHNEISYNDTYDWEAKVDGCGCTGGGKFWDTNGATITNNYVHDNQSNGMWADTNNRGFLLDGNYFADNQNVGFEYEISYNARISNNTFVGNGIETGKTGDAGFPTTAIYLSESGSDSRVDTPYKNTFEITNNLFKNNWGGVVIWENADRFCGSPANTSGDSCTLVSPSVVTVDTCNETNIANAPYYDDCRWKSQNIKVHGNTFISNPSDIDPNCDTDYLCGFNGIFSQWGTYPDWSPYQGTTVETHITQDQNNTFYDNTYQGTWNFMAPELGKQVSWSEWRGSTYGQDAGSTMN